MQTLFRLFPQGRQKAFTLSYDDGFKFDRRFVDLLNRLNLKATFHLNSAFFGAGPHVAESEVATLYKGHEISMHAATHPSLDLFSAAEIAGQILADKAKLESLAGYPVTGFSYPYGTYDREVVETLRGLGVEYARTIKATSLFDLPTDFLKWHPTCHHRELAEHVERFINLKTNRPTLFYCWGHSFEFDRENTWDYAETNLEKIAGRDDIWYATNLEICRYVRASKNLVISANGELIYNPSAISVWVKRDDKTLEIPPGTVKSE